MGRILYSTIINLYWALAWLTSFTNSKAKKFIAGREGWTEVPWNNDSRKTVWIHTASLGEFEQGRPLIEKIKKYDPDIKIILTFFSPSGYEIRKNYDKVDLVIYLPKDSRSNARKFFDKFSPNAVIFVKYEFWYHFLYEANKRTITTLLVSGIFRKEQLFFKPWGGFYRNILKYFNHLFVQNPESASLLKSIGISNYEVSGDTRFDRVIEVMESKKEIPWIDRFIQNEPTMVIGSMWEEDLIVLEELLNGNPFNMKFIIAPHDVDESFIQKITKKLSNPFLKYSHLENINGDTADILIIDNIGMLSSLYAYCRYAYVGGAFGKGLNNTLEAAVYGVPVFFGDNNYLKYQEAVDLRDLGGAFPVGNYSEIFTQIEMLENDPQLRESTGKKSAEYVENYAGATKKIFDYLKSKVNL